ncbi:hypothetical protein ACE02D_01965 [Shewanella bicestrii]|uniref:hypothetical protein n=1 Tax=Shewanella sp. GD03713 TaxID=2975372 RepID=UPI00244C85FD|nr:hypothetical protein [Shewanella sp. GD03713]MDH1471830.1 hypothetical protein [Shewanella sp. GD03713]
MKNNYLYSVTDKALYDALNQYKITSNHIVDMFLKRGVIVSKQTNKKVLARNFCRYHHDYYDHQVIAEHLGIHPRKEKITSSFIESNSSKDDFWNAAEILKESIIADNDQCNVYIDSDKIIIDITYSSLHYDKSEFNQVVKKNANIEIVKSKDNSYIIRRPDNDQFDDYVSQIVEEIGKNGKIEKKEVSLFSVPDHNLRSKFFIDFVSILNDYKLRDVSDVFVFNPNSVDVDDINDFDNYDIPEIKRVSLKGKSVLDSQELKDLFDKGFYIWRIRWTVEERLADPDIFEFEAQFSDIVHCCGLSYISKGYWKYKGNGEYNKGKSQLDNNQNSKFITLFENAALDIMKAIHSEYKGVSQNEHSEE